MRILRSIIIAFFLIQAVNIQAQGVSYIGGMMMHCGYIGGGQLNVAGGDPASINIAGVTTGIGGRLLFNITDRWRIGSEGYVSDLEYGDRRTASIGWGGIATDYGVQFGKFRPTLGVTLGGGSYENICVVDTPQGNDVVQPTVWNQYSLFVVVPYVGVEYTLTSKIKLYSRLDRITAPAARHSDFATGARLHFGFMFSH